MNHPFLLNNCVLENSQKLPGGYE